MQLIFSHCLIQYVLIYAKIIYHSYECEKYITAYKKKGVLVKYDDNKDYCKLIEFLNHGYSLFLPARKI